MSLIFLALISVVLLSPLALGAVQTWAWTALASAIAVLLAFWSVRVLIGFETLTVGLKSAWPFALPFGLAVAWIVAQGTSLTPETWHHPLWQSAADALGRDLDGAISIDPHGTWSALARLLTYAAVFWLSLQFCRDPKRAQTVVYAVVGTGMVYAAYGLVAEFSGADAILWLEKSAYTGTVTSTFVNRNTYATYAGLGLVCTTAMLIRHIRRVAASAHSGREGALRLIERGFGQGWWLLVAWVVLATALMLTQSRGGLLSAVVGHIGLLVAFVATRRTKLRHAAMIGLPIIFIGTASFLYSGDQTAERLAQTSIDTEGRIQVYERTMDAASAAPLLGTGYGSFEDVFRFYRTEDITAIFDKAHSTYLENALELGLPAAGLIVLTIFALLARCLIGVRLRRQGTVFPIIGVAATLLVALHAAVDFSLQIPAVAVTYALIMGAAVAQSWSSRRDL